MLKFQLAFAFMQKVHMKFPIKLFAKSSLKHAKFSRKKSS